MRLLVLDTCLGACQAAVAADGALIASLSEPMTRGHQERLAPMVREVMTAAGLAFADLEAVAVTVGPGSFTGLRVGLAFAKGLTLALGIPCLGVGALAALAASGPASGPRTAVIDAGRGQVWLQIFDGEAALAAPGAASREAVVGPSPLIGPAASGLAAAGQAAIDLPWPSLAAIVRRALAFPEPARPLYLRAPDARPKGA